MAARRCSVDGINFPGEAGAAKCPVCGEMTDWVTNAVPDEDWQDKVAALLEMQHGAEIDPAEIPKVDVRITVRGDGLFVSSWDLYAAGLRKEVPLQPHALFQVGAQTFEVIEYLREPNREYLVKSFSTSLDDDDLARLAGCRA